MPRRGRGCFRTALPASPLRPLRARWMLGAALFLASPSVWALSSDDATERATESITAVEAQAGKVRQVTGRDKRYEPEKMVAAGELFFRTKAYDQAIDVLNKVVELHRQGKASQATAADATFLLAEAYFESGQLYSARRYYRVVTDRASEPQYATFAGRAASRLVDVALRTRRLDELPDVIERVNRLGVADASGSIQYARAKALFAQGDLAQAEAAANAVPAGSEYAQRATYLLGVVQTKQAVAAAPADEQGKKQPDYSVALATFRRAAEMPGKTSEDRHVTDLSWMAVGRLLYESGNYLEAARAYTNVRRSSPEFSNALYELAWSYVRLGDYERGQRALEVLSVLDPGRIDAADASLLHADLLLRSGQFEKALLGYEQARATYDPLHKQVAEFLSAHSDPTVYYDRLTAGEIEGTGDLPPLAIEWAREEAESERVFAIVDDVSRSRKMVRSSRQLVAQLRGVLNSPARAKVFPSIRRELEKALGLLNQVALARRTLALGLDDEAGSVSGELRAIRAERRKLMRRMAQLPATPADFQLREASSEKAWNGVSQKLQRLSLHADYLQAMVNGLRRVLVDADKYQVSQSSLERFRQEIAANEADLEKYRARISALRDSIEIGRAQAGFGDERFVEDDQVRERFRELFSREVALVAAGGDDSSAVEYARSIQPLLARADRVTNQLTASRNALESDAAHRGTDVEKVVDQEAQAIEAYAHRLDELDQTARVLVGEVAMQNFRLVRDRLKSVVMRADVGIVQHAWELREEQQSRVRELQRERAREERFLNDELREVIDDAEALP